MPDLLREYLPILIFLVIAVALAGIVLIVAYATRLKARHRHA